MCGGFNESSRATLELPPTPIFDLICIEGVFSRVCFPRYSVILSDKVGGRGLGSSQMRGTDWH